MSLKLNCVNMIKRGKLKKLESFNNSGNKEEIKTIDSYESRPRQLTLSAAQNNYEEAKLKYNELFDYLNESPSLLKDQKLTLIKPSILLLYDASEHLKKANKKIGSTKVLEDIDNEVVFLQQKLEVLKKESANRQNDMKHDSSVRFSNVSFSPSSNNCPPDCLLHCTQLTQTQDSSPSSNSCPPDCLLHCAQLIQNSDNDKVCKDSSFLNNKKKLFRRNGEISVFNDAKKQKTRPTSLLHRSHKFNKNNGKRKIRGSTSSAKKLKIQNTFSISVELFESLPVDCRHDKKIIRYLKSCKNVNQLLLNILLRKQSVKDIVV